MIRHFANLFLSVLPPSRLFYFRRLLLLWSGLELEIGVKFCGRGWVYGRGRVRIAADTWLSPGVIFHSHLDAPIYIGSRVDVGPGVEFITGSHVMGTSERRAGNGTAKSITIGNGCWIGAKSIILGGVSVGPGSVVAAGSIVTRDVPANVLVAGVPAKIKKSLS